MLGSLESAGQWLMRGAWEHLVIVALLVKTAVEVIARMRIPGFPAELQTLSRSRLYYKKLAVKLTADPERQPKARAVTNCNRVPIITGIQAHWHSVP